MHRFEITIREITPPKRTHARRVVASDEIDARTRAIVAIYGRGCALQRDHGLPDGYGSIIRTLTRSEMQKRASGATFLADVLVGRVRVEVKQLASEAAARDLEALRVEAGQAGDDAMVATTTAALDGDVEAERRAWLATDEAREMGEAPRLTAWQDDDDDCDRGGER